MVIEHPTAKFLRKRVEELEDEKRVLKRQVAELREELQHIDQDQEELPDIYDISTRLEKVIKKMERFGDDLNYRKTEISNDKLQDVILSWTLALDDIFSDLT